MTKIGLLSDTHGHLDQRIFEHFKSVDEIWHAGDIGNLELADQLADFKPFKAVYGNIDSNEVRKVHPLNHRFLCEGIDVWMTHIGGYPDRYSPRVKKEIYKNPPKLFISGHSHILKAVNDKKLNLLHLNPGAAGIQGFHQVKTLMRFEIDKEIIKNLEVIELGKR